MKAVKWLLVVYCSIISLVAAFDLLVDPTRQPMRNIALIVCMTITLVGIFTRRRDLILALPILALFQAAYTAASTGNLAYALGALGAMLLPALLALAVLKSFATEHGAPVEGRTNQEVGRPEKTSAKIVKLADSGSIKTFVLQLAHGQKIEVTPKKSIIRSFSQHSEGGISHTVEYRFEGDRLLARLLDKSHVDLGDEVRYVEDGVVLASALRKRFGGSKVIPIEEDILDLSAQVQWHPYDYWSPHLVRFFIMSKHPELFSVAEIRRKVRMEIERLRFAIDQLHVEVRNLGYETFDTPDGFGIRKIAGSKESDPEVPELKSLIEKLGLSLLEISNQKAIEKNVLKFLDEKLAA